MQNNVQTHIDVKDNKYGGKFNRFEDRKKEKMFLAERGRQTDSVEIYFEKVSDVNSSRLEKLKKYETGYFGENNHQRHGPGNESGSEFRSDTENNDSLVKPIEELGMRKEISTPLVKENNQQPKVGYKTLNTFTRQQVKSEINLLNQGNKISAVVSQRRQNKPMNHHEDEKH